MDDTAYRNAIARKAALQNEIREIDHFLEMYGKFSSWSQSVQAAAEQVFSDQRDFLVTDASGRVAVIETKPLSKKLGPSDYADLAEKYIEQAGHPLTRTELVNAFEAANIELPSPDKARYLGTILWRNRVRFPNVPGRGYTTQRLLTPAEKERIEESLRSTDLSEVARTKLDEVSAAQARNTPLERAEVLDIWDANQQILSMVDGRLLAAGRYVKQGDLNVQEKRYLRQRYIDHLRDIETSQQS